MECRVFCLVVVVNPGAPFVLPAHFFEGMKLRSEHLSNLAVTKRGWIRKRENTHGYVGSVGIW